MIERIIRKATTPGQGPHNLGDYDAVCRTFSWQEATRELAGLPGNRGVNIAFEAIDRHVRQLPELTVVQPPTHPIKPMIDIEQFKSVDLRVARVLAAERVAKSTKLLKLRVSIGTEERQVIAGIGQHYQPEALVGKKIVLVSNLAPAKLMGEESQGMLLAASDDSGKLTILTVSEDISEGSIVK